MLATVSSGLSCWIIQTGSYFDLLVGIIITLTFLRCMSDYDAIQLAANQSTDSVLDASMVLGIDTHAPLVLSSSFSFILTLYITFLT